MAVRYRNRFLTLNINKMKNSILNPQSIIISIFTILFFVVVIFGDMKS